MKRQRSKVVFKVLVIMLCVVLATYAGLFLAYQQILHESDVYTAQMANSARVEVVGISP